MKYLRLISIALLFSSYAAMQSTINGTMNGADKDAERLGNASDSVVNDIEDSLNPARDVKLILASGLTELASMEIRELEKTSDGKNIVQIFSMGLGEYK